MAEPVKRAWMHINPIAMVTVTCTGCTEESPPVAVPSRWREGKHDKLIAAFEAIGWDVEPTVSRCPICRSMPR